MAKQPARNLPHVLPAAPRRLNKAEIVGLQAADREWHAAVAQAQQAEGARNEIYQDLGLDPARSYRLEPDGTLTETTPNGGDA